MRLQAIHGRFHYSNLPLKSENFPLESLSVLVVLFPGSAIVDGCCVCYIIQEYETGQTAEARVVKDLDKFDMIFQAFEYEKGQ